MPARRGHHLEPHPALAVLRHRRITNRKVASVIGVSPGWVGAVLLRHVPAPLKFREGLARLLDAPVDELFLGEPGCPRYPGDLGVPDPPPLAG